MKVTCDHFTGSKVQLNNLPGSLRKHYGHRAFFSSGHKEAGTVYLKNAMSSRTPGADSGTGTLAAFRLPRESGSPAGSATRQGKGGLVPGTGDSGPGRGEATPCRAPLNSVRVARHRAELRPRPRGDRHRADSDPPGDKSWGWHHRVGAQLGSPSRCGGSESGVRAPPPLPRCAPGDLLIKTAAAPRPRVRPLPPRPGGGRSARPSRSSARPGRQPSGGPPSRRGIKNPETPDPPSDLGIPESPPPPHRQPPPSPPSPATPPRDRARPAPAADARPRTRPRDPGAAGAPIPGRSRRSPPTARREAGPDRPIRSRLRGESSLIGPLWAPGSRPRALPRLELRSARPDCGVSSAHLLAEENQIPSEEIPLVVSGTTEMLTLP